VAVACRAEPVTEFTAAVPVETPTAESLSADPTPVEEPTAVPEPPVQEPEAIAVGELFAGKAPEPFIAPAEWNQPPPLNPAVTEGRLANGMRYLVRPNDRPGASGQLMLVVQAGSLNEEPGTEGLAHFLEHMMFNGTEQFPGNQLVSVLEGFGATFGPDVNAYTSFEETVYQLQVPINSDSSVQLGLDVLFQWATAATLNTDDVVAERGVVREELRLSAESVAGRIGDQLREVIFDGTGFKDKLPIGLAEEIETMTESELREFYERWYRPELMTIIAVGDFDAAAVIGQIESTFVQPVSAEVQPPLETPDVGELVEPTFDVITDPEVQRTELEALWRLPRPAVNDAAGARENLVRSITFNMIGDRLLSQVQSGSSELLQATASANGFLGDSTLVSLTASASTGSQEAALVELLTQIEQARQFGFEQDELDRQLDEFRAEFEQFHSSRNTQQDADLAAELVEYSLGRASSPDETVRRDLLLEILDSIQLDDAERFLYEVLESNPFVYVSGPSDEIADLPEPASLEAIYDSIIGRVVDPPGERQATSDELMERPAPAQIVESTADDFGSTFTVTYENGARLMYTQTTVAENVVIMRADSLGGFFAVDGPEVPLLDVTPNLVGGSGFESVDLVALDRLLSTSIVSLSSSIGRSSETISGESSTEDLEVMLQLLHLQMTEPVITDVRVRQFEEQWRPLTEDPESNPDFAGRLRLWQLRYGDSPWFRFLPNAEDIDALDAELLLNAFKDRFADAGDFIFAFAGDFDPDVLVDLGARYIGTLPDSGRREEPIDRDPGVPEENLVATVEAGVGDQGELRINWESPYPFSIETDVAAAVLELVVDARLRDLIREELGAAYSPRAAVSVLAEPKSWVDTIINVESDPDRVAEVSEVVRAELDRIRAGDFDQGYLDRAVEQLSNDWGFFTNSELIDEMIFYTRYPERDRVEVDSKTAIAERLTIADLASTANLVFPPTRSVEVRSIPAAE